MLDIRIRQPFDYRYAILHEAFKKCNAQSELLRIALIPTYLVADKLAILAWHRYFTYMKFEGIIIRKLARDAPVGGKVWEGTLYRGSRANNLIKYKKYKDAEGIVVGLTTAEGNQDGAAIFVVRVTCKDQHGNDVTTDVPMVPNGPIPERRSWTADPSLVMGRQVTYEYLEVSVYGVPREPRVKGFREVEGL